MLKKLLVLIATLYVVAAFAAVDVNQASVAELDSIKGDRKSTRLNSSHIQKSRMPSSA